MIVEDLRKDPALREATFELALIKGVLQWQVERLNAGERDDVPEDPATWLIHQGKLVIDSIAKVANLTYRDEIRAACALLEPALKVIQDAIVELVPAEIVPALHSRISDGLARILVPHRV